MKPDDRDNLFARALAGELSGDERREFERRLSASPGERALFEKTAAAWKRTAPDGPVSVPPAESGWPALAGRIGSVSREEGRKPAGLRIRPFRVTAAWTAWPPALRAAACAAAALAVVLGAALLRSGGMTAVSVPNGRRAEIVLADGTRVRLNGGTVFRHPKRFSGLSRRVRLEGEAFFEVKADPDRPFSVLTDGVRTTVLGTRFDVRARDGATRVFVDEGRVGVESLSDGGSGTLVKGQACSVSAGGKLTRAEHRNPDLSIGWLTGRLVFERAPLSEILAELERVHGIRAVLAEAKLGRRTATVTVENVQPDTLVSSLCLALGLKKTETNEGYRLSER